MDRGDILLQGFRQQLSGWFNTISRSTGSELEVQQVPADGFILRASWKGGQYERHFSKRVCFGSSFSLSTAAWRIEKRACDYARDFMRDVLSRRGVL